MTATTYRDGVAVLGDSFHGVPLTTLAIQNERKTFLYTGADAPPEGMAEGVQFTDDLEAITAQCGLMLLVVPASEVRVLVRALSPTLDGSQMILHSVRGFEPGSAQPISGLIRDECCVRKIGAFLGPALVTRHDATRPNAVVVASRFSEVVRHTQQAFARPTFRVYSNPDITGVEIASAAAGAIALAIGLCLEMDLGPATLGMLLTRGVAEMTRLAVAVGGAPHTCSGLSGLGDLLVQREVESREVQIGRRLTRGISASDAVVELGHSDTLDAVRALTTLVEQHDVEANIIPTVDQLLRGQLDAAGALMQLMTLSQMQE